MPEKVYMMEPFGRGGFAQYSFCLTSALQERGLNVSLVTANDYEFSQQAAFDVKPLFRLRQGGGHHAFAGLKNQGRKMGGLVSGVYAFRKALKTEHPAVVHLQGGSVAIVDWLLSRATFGPIKKQGGRVVYTAHNILPHEAAVTDKIIYRFIYEQADAIIVHTQADVDALTRLTPKPAPIFVVPHGGDYRFFEQQASVDRDEARQRLGIGPGEKVILFFGAIMAYKGLDILIQACGLVQRRFADFRLVIAGKPQESFDKYQRALDEERLGKRAIKKLGHVPNDEVGLYFNAADVVALPYKTASQSGVLQVAYTFGLPVICSNVGGLAEVVKDGANGFLFQPGDSQALAGLLIKVLTDEPLAKRLGSNGRRLTQTKFSWKTIAEQTVGVYRAGHDTERVGL